MKCLLKSGACQLASNATCLLHVIPVGDDSMLDGVLEGEDSSLALGLVSHVGVLLSHAHHHSLMARASHDGGEDSPGGVISSKPSLAHTRSIVYYQRGYIVVTHLD